jgi:glycosyltransferase involved in cell wall biosynthesis
VATRTPLRARLAARKRRLPTQRASTRADREFGRVVFLIPHLSGGGAERAVLNLAPALPRSRGVVLSEWRGGELEALFDAQEVMSVSRDLARPSRAARILRLGRELRRLRPRVVVSLLSPLVATEAARFARVPVIHWLQNPCSRVLPFAGGGLRARLNRRVLRHVLQRSAAIVGATPGLVEELWSLGADALPMTVIPNPARLPDLASPEDGAPTRVVSIGRLASQKRHDLLLAGFARIADTRTCRLLIFGTGPLRERLEVQADALSVRHLVDFAGFVEGPAERLTANDVFALCSDFEGFGNVFVEVLARGVRIVATDAPYGARFVLGGVKIARLIPTGSSMAVGDALAEALDAGPPSQELRAQARVRAEQFSVARVANQFEDFLDRVV